MASVSGRIPSSHSEAYTAFAWLCQKITASGLFSKTKFRKARASGSENGLDPALTVLSRHLLVGFQSQSKLRLRSTSWALKRPEAKISVLVETSLEVKRPSFLVTLYIPSGLREGMTVTVKLFGMMAGLATR